MSDSNIICGVCKTYCCVPQCKNGAWKNKNLSFHKFPFVYDNWPRDKQESTLRRRNAWIRALKIGKSVTKTMVVCSSHFQKSDYFPTEIKTFEKNAIPTLNLPVSSGQILEPRERKERYKLISCFPNDKVLLEKLVLAVCRKDFKPSNCFTLCSKRTTEDCVQREAFANAKLTEDTVPTISDHIGPSTQRPRQLPMLHEDIRSCVNSGICSLNTEKNASDTTTDMMEDTTCSAMQDQQGSNGKCNTRYQPYIERISVSNIVTSPTPEENPKLIDMDIQTPDDEVEDRFSLFGDFVANLLCQLPLHKALQCQCEIMKVLKHHQC